MQTKMPFRLHFPLLLLGLTVIHGLNSLRPSKPAPSAPAFPPTATTATTAQAPLFINGILGARYLTTAADHYKNDITPPQFLSIYTNFTTAFKTGLAKAADAVKMNTYHAFEFLEGINPVKEPSNYVPFFERCFLQRAGMISPVHLSHSTNGTTLSKKGKYIKHLEHLHAVQYRAAFAARARRHKLGLPIPSRGTAIKGLTTAALLGTYAYVVYNATGTTTTAPQLLLPASAPALAASAQVLALTPPQTPLALPAPTVQLALPAPTQLLMLAALAAVLMLGPPQQRLMLGAPSAVEAVMMPTPPAMLATPKFVFSACNATMVPPSLEPLGFTPLPPLAVPVATVTPSEAEWAAAAVSLLQMAAHLFVGFVIVICVVVPLLLALAFFHHMGKGKKATTTTNTPAATSGVPAPATTIMDETDRNHSESKLARRQSTVAAVTDSDLLDSMVGAVKGEGGPAAAVSGAGELVKPRGGLKAKAAKFFDSLKTGRRRSRGSTASSIGSSSDSSIGSSTSSSSTGRKGGFGLFVNALKAGRRRRSTSSSSTESLDFSTSGLFEDCINGPRPST